MSKWLTVVALVVLVLAGALGLRSIVASNASVSASSVTSGTIWANGPGPIPPIPPPPGGGHFRANGPGPIPPIPPPGPGH
jgi:hypothetical protein